MSPIKMHQIESGIRLVVELFNDLNNHKVEDIIRLLSDDCILVPLTGRKPLALRRRLQ